MRAFLTVAAGAALLLAACKGGGSESESTPVSDDAFTWLAAQAANAVLLTDADLPAEFDPEVDDGSDELPDPEFNLTGECAEFNEYMNIDTDWMNSAAEAESGDFEDGGGTSVNSDSAAFREVGKAEEEIRLFERFFATCKDQLAVLFVDYFEQLGESEGTQITDVSVDFSDLTVPERGDWSAGNRLRMEFTVEGITIEVVVDSIEVRVGRMLGSVEYTHSGSPDEEFQNSLVEIVTSRLETEDAKLPQ